MNHPFTWWKMHHNSHKMGCYRTANMLLHKIPNMPLIYWKKYITIFLMGFLHSSSSIIPWRSPLDGAKPSWMSPKMVTVRITPTAPCFTQNLLIWTPPPQSRPNMFYKESCISLDSYQLLNYPLGPYNFHCASITSFWQLLQCCILQLLEQLLHFLERF